MNLDRIQDHAAARAVSGPRPGTGRIDLTSAEPAAPASVSLPAGQRPHVASIKGVLTADEERAIADMFAPGRTGYDRAGAATKPASVPGLRLNVQA